MRDLYIDILEVVNPNPAKYDTFLIGDLSRHYHKRFSIAGRGYPAKIGLTAPRTTAFSHVRKSLKM
jgi:hypothetical protein